MISVIGLCLLSPFQKALSSTTCVQQVNFIDMGLGAYDIWNYLSSEGYTVYGIPTQNGNNWTVHTSLGTAHYMTTVFTDGTSIIGHEDFGI